MLALLDYCGNLLGISYIVQSTPRYSKFRHTSSVLDENRLVSLSICLALANLSMPILGNILQRYFEFRALRIYCQDLILLGSGLQSLLTIRLCHESNSVRHLSETGVLQTVSYRYCGKLSSFQ